MRNIFKGLALAISASFIVACGGGGPVGQAMDHQLAMLKIVEANKTDVAKAKSELEAYIKTNDAALKQVAADMEKMKAEMGDKPDMSKMADIMKANASKFEEIQALRKKLREEAKEVYNDKEVSDLLYSVKGL